MLLSSKNAHTILDALNHYFHHACQQLQKENLGDVERENWVKIRNNVGNMLLETNVTNTLVGEQHGVDREIGEVVDEHLFDWL